MLNTWRYKKYFEGKIRTAHKFLIGQLIYVDGCIGHFIDRQQYWQIYQISTYSVWTIFNFTHLRAHSLGGWSGIPHIISIDQATRMQGQLIIQVAQMPRRFFLKTTKLLRRQIRRRCSENRRQHHWLPRRLLQKPKKTKIWRRDWIPYSTNTPLRRRAWNPHRCNSHRALMKHIRLS